MFTVPTTFAEDAGKAAGIQILFTSLLDDLLILSRNFCITSMSKEWGYTLECLGLLDKGSCTHSVVKSAVLLGLANISTRVGFRPTISFQTNKTFHVV